MGRVFSRDDPSVYEEIYPLIYGRKGENMTTKKSDMAHIITGIDGEEGSCA